MLGKVYGSIVQFQAENVIWEEGLAEKSEYRHTKRECYKLLKNDI